MAKRPARPDDIYLLRKVSDPRVSPDGRQVAYVVHEADREADENRTSIHVANLDGSGGPRRFTQGAKDHSPRWSPDGRFLAYISNRDDEDQICLAPLAGGEPRQVTRAKFGVSQPAWAPDGRHIAYVARTGEFTPEKDRKPGEKNAPRVIRDLAYRLDGVGYADNRRAHIFTMDVDTAEERQLTDGDWNDAQPAWSPDGKSIVFVSDRQPERFQRQWRSDLWLVSDRGARPRRLTRGKGAAGQPTFSPDGSQIAFIGHENGNEYFSRNVEVFVVPTEGARPRSISRPLDRSAFGFPAPAGQSLVWLPDSSSVLFLAADHGSVVAFAATLAGGIERVIEGDLQVQALDITPDGKQVVFMSVWPDAPAEVYVRARSGGRRKNLSHANDPLLAEVEMAPVRRLTYEGGDGLEIEAFVLRPPDTARAAPTVLNIHGGPHSLHPEASFSLEHQMLATNGYAVFLPNIRGSSGYGEKFTSACVHDWGGKDYEDLMLGLDRLIADGIADPRRLFVSGYSYGGFMTSWVVGHTDRFRAAIVGAPVSDQLSMAGTTDIPLFLHYEIGGNRWAAEEAHRFRSPITYLQNVTSPVLLIHHEGDLRCPVGQSEEIFQGLKVLDKEVEFVRYPGGGHAYAQRTPSQFVDALERQLEWWARHDADTPAKRDRKRAGRPVGRSRRR
jgi:dipeptidyl aminopeptidase/acylaminoacyl peptidase